ncbi:MAG: SCO1664 family protein [Chloroflexi bacterium]|nr:SCO1664 family protein [Chloroflexota bacterium]
MYKPRRGEAPLYDFPDGTLYRRERAAYVVSQALGWPAIPPTVIRDGPHGPGTVQLYVDHNPQAHYFTFGAEHAEQLRQLALFDVVANNADRKGGHCLESWSGAVWSIDHGLTFHRQPKLRTVIWDFRGDPLPPALSADLLAVCERLETGADPLRAELLELIAAGELAALLRRAEAVLEEGQYPDYGPYRNTPWPAI